MKKLDIVAVLKGLGANIVLGLVLGFFVGLVAGFVSVVHKQPVVSLPLSLSLVIGLLCAFVGGYVTAKTAQQEPMLNAIVLSIVVIIIGAGLAYFSRFPLWYNMASFGLVVPFTLAGGYLYLKKGVRI